MVDVAEALVLSYLHGCFEDGWEHGNQCFLQFFFTILILPAEGDIKYLVLDPISDLFIALHTLEVMIRTPYGVQASVEHNLSETLILYPF